MNLYTFLSKLFNMSLTGAIAIICILLLRLLLKRAPKVISYALWIVVLFRLLCPVSITSNLSLFGLLDAPSTNTVTGTSSMEYVPENIVHTEFPEVAIPVPGVSEIINSTLPQGQEQFVADPLEAPVAIGTYVWLLGVMGMAVYSVISYVRLKRKLLIVSPLQENIWLADEINTPFVMGLIRPRIYLPSDTEEHQMPYLILHEKHHIRRGDHIFKTLAFLALSLHWFNPLVWAAFVYANKDMEMSCDEAVVKKLGDHILADYTASLLSLATGKTIIAGVPLAFGEGDTKGRIRNLAHWKKPAFWVILVAVIACVALGIGLLTNPTKENASEDNEDGYYLLIGAEGVETIEVATANTSGGVENADGSAFRVGEKVWLEQLQGVIDLRGITIMAFGENGEILYTFSVPKEATADEIAAIVGSDPWLLAPTSFGIAEANKNLTNDIEIGLILETVAVTGTPLEMAKEVVAEQFSQMQDFGYSNWRIESLAEEYKYGPNEEQGLGSMLRVSVYGLEYAFFTENPDEIALPENMTMDEEGWAKHEYPATYLCVIADGGALSYIVLTENDCEPGDDIFTEELKRLLGVGTETAEDYYSMVTSAYAKEVEHFAAGIKEDILFKDWKSLSAKLAYPIQIGDKTINSSKEFLDIDIDGMLSQEFVNAIDSETCREMFFNYQGIMMGETGQIWIASVDNGAGQWELKVIALNGLIGQVSLERVMDRIAGQGLEQAIGYEKGYIGLQKDAVIKLCVSESGKYEAYGFISPEYGQRGILLNNIIDGEGNWNYIDSDWGYGKHVPVIKEIASHEVQFSYYREDGSWCELIFDTYETGTMSVREAYTETDGYEITDKVSSIVVINGNTGERKTITKDDANTYNDLMKLYGQLDFAAPSEENTRVGYQYRMILQDAEGNKLQSVTPYKDGVTVDNIFFQYDNTDPESGAAASLRLMEYLEKIMNPE